VPDSGAAAAEEAVADNATGVGEEEVADNAFEAGVAGLDVVDSWVCPANKVYEFQANGDFLVDRSKVGTWAREGKTVTVTYGGGKVLFYLDSVTSGSLYLEHVSRGGPAPFVCTAGTAQVYRTMVRDSDIADRLDEALEGKWQSFRGSMEFEADGSYTMDSEDCHGGTWSLKGETLTMKDRDCDDPGLGGKVTRMTTNHFDLDGETWFRTPGDTGTVPLSNL